MAELPELEGEAGEALRRCLRAVKPQDALVAAEDAIRASALLVGSEAQLAAHFGLALALSRCGNEEGAAVALRAAAGLASVHPRGAVWSAWFHHQGPDR
jgi:hypothetical protein